MGAVSGERCGVSGERQNCCWQNHAEWQLGANTILLEGTGRVYNDGLYARQRSVIQLSVRNTKKIGKTGYVWCQK